MPDPHYLPKKHFCQKFLRYVETAEESASVAHSSKETKEYKTPSLRPGDHPILSDC